MGAAALRGASTVRPHTTAPKKMLTIGEFLKTHGTTLDKHIAERFKMGIREGLKRSNLSLKDIESFLESKDFKTILDKAVEEFKKHFGANEKIPNPKEALDHLNSRIKGDALDLTQKIAPALENAKRLGKSLDVKTILPGKKVINIEERARIPKDLGAPKGRGVADISIPLDEARLRNVSLHEADRKHIPEFLSKTAGRIKKGANKIPYVGPIVAGIGVVGTLIATGGNVAKAAEKVVGDMLDSIPINADDDIVSDEMEKEGLRRNMTRKK